MTARKVHFDFTAEQQEAWCGATPREGAAPLELSERRKDVDCANCLALITEYDDEVNAQVALAESIMDGDNVTDLTAIKFGAYYTPEPTTDPKYTNEAIAARHGLDSAIVVLAISEGILKR